MKPRFPIYVVSKGRWQHTRHITARALERMQVSYHLIIEEQEYDDYAREVRSDRLLILSPAFKDAYDPCMALGPEDSRGPGPARNFAWEHARQSGAAWHWVMDDNIHEFYRLHRNAKVAVHDGVFFRWMEDFALRYENLGMCGPNYESMVPRKYPRVPYVMNTRIYSCNLIRTDLPFRWRGRYNEDTILSLDLLKSDWCTVQFNTFLQNKPHTQRIQGGNTAEFYAREGTAPKSRMLVEQHPDVARMVWRYNRWHHVVDYRPFKGLALRRRPGVDVSSSEGSIRLMRRTAHAQRKNATPAP